MIAVIVPVVPIVTAQLLLRNLPTGYQLNPVRSGGCVPGTRRVADDQGMAVAHDRSEPVDSMPEPPSGLPILLALLEVGTRANDARTAPTDPS